MNRPTHEDFAELPAEWSPFARSGAPPALRARVRELGVHRARRRRRTSRAIAWSIGAASFVSTLWAVPAGLSAGREAKSAMRARGLEAAVQTLQGDQLAHEQWLAVVDVWTGSEERER